MDIQKMVDAELQKGYSGDNALAKVCQDIVLKAIANSSLNRNVTIKGGVVMRSKTNNVRRATQDLDIDFIRYLINIQAELSVVLRQHLQQVSLSWPSAHGLARQERTIKCSMSQWYLCLQQHSAACLSL